MSEQRDRERDERIPATRDADTPASRRATPPARSADTPAASYATHPEFPSAPPAAEFLSLTYTLPYHLVERAHEIARESYRSQSEVVADALRLYLQTWKARRTHARVSTVEGFSYQEVAVAEALVEEEAEISISATPPEAEAPPDEAAGKQPSGDAAAPPDEGDGEGDGQGDGQGETPDTTATDDEIDTADATAVAESPVSTHDTDDAEPVEAAAASPASTDEQADSTVAVDAPDPDEGDREPASETQHDVGDDDSTKVDTELREFSDPAATVRRELQAVSGEPIHSLRLQRALEKIAARIDVKDHSPENHSATVAEMAHKLARLRGLKGRDLQNIRMAGLAHDIGKASIPDHILTKRRPSPEEMGMIRKYPEFGAELLRIVPALEPIVPLVASHQERWNGNGYPDGRQGGDIPVASQIVALCDVYQVLTNDRHYRPAYTEERARQIIRQNVGTLWNPDIARTFLKMINGDEMDEE